MAPLGDTNELQILIMIPSHYDVVIINAIPSSVPRMKGEGFITMMMDSGRSNPRVAKPLCTDDNNGFRDGVKARRRRILSEIT